LLLMVPAVAVNVLVVAPADTVVDAGTVRRPLLLDSVTAAPPTGAACDSVTVQVDVPALARLLGLQDSELIVAGPVSVMVAVRELLL
jgi:hypothetical protein